ncbi:MAG: nucleotidyl transferase AbiEii/AbiGii toxin family protein [Gammaproteobacteria bacterium]
MAARDGYRVQVEFLIRCFPAVASAPDFGLKGGTAINLFLRDMPRLSVDIDLTYLPVSDRDTALTDIRAQLAAIADGLKRTVPGVDVQLVGGDAPRLLVDKSGARIKVEPSVVIRGSLVPPVLSDLCPAAQQTYELFVEIQRLDSADLYAGKLCAALDRQHPRDLFDVMHLQAAGSIPDSIREAFVAYLAGHRRPIAELLRPNRKPIEDLFANHFVGMTEVPVERADLEAARTQLFEWAASALNENERRFLLSIKQGEPNWALLPFEGLDRWPAIQWKLHNIRLMRARSHKAVGCDHCLPEGNY